jgi:cytidine deaminase
MRNPQPQQPGSDENQNSSFATVDPTPRAEKSASDATLIDLTDKRIHAERAAQSELFIGLIGATGTDLSMVQVALCDGLRIARYVPVRIRLSELIEEQFAVSRPSTEYERIKQAMDLGNELRETNNAAVAMLGILQVRRFRQEHWESNSAKLPRETSPRDYPSIPLAKHAYLFRSLKHPDEVELLRKIYGDSFYLISVYSARENRKAALEKRIAESEDSARWDRRGKKADLLMRRDFIEADLPNGQNVRDSFPLADLFVNSDDPDDCKRAIWRFVKMIFGDPQQTPTLHEYCMFHATGAALRSGDLGRQVGAIVATKYGDVISHGTNESPKAHGGQAWIGDKPDLRGVAQQKDVGDERKKKILVDLLQRLLDNNRIAGIDGEGIRALADETFSEKRPKWMKGAELLEVIGYYRSVHGETAAIINAARLGQRIKGCNLYVTAFPCHECARHILAAGIDEVFYVEPYPKSLAGEHYPESIVIDGEAGENQIAFRQFVGIAPRVYVKFFAALERKKKDGSAIKWDAETCSVRYHHHWLAYTAKEAAFCSDLAGQLKDAIPPRSELDERSQKEATSGGSDSDLRGGQQLANMETETGEIKHSHDGNI